MVLNFEMVVNNTCKKLKYNAFKKYIKLEYLNKF